LVAQYSIYNRIVSVHLDLCCFESSYVGHWIDRIVKLYVWNLQLHMSPLSELLSYYHILLLRNDKSDDIRQWGFKTSSYINDKFTD